MTAQAKIKIFSAMNMISAEQSGPQVLVACPSWELHEIGAQIVAYFCATRMCRVIFLGANLPLANLIHFSSLTKPDAVILSCTSDISENKARAYFTELNPQILPICPVWVGGQGIRRFKQLFEIENPVNKGDIVRLEDSYGRAGIPYGGEDDVDVPEKGLSGSGKWERVGDCEVCVRTINSLGWVAFIEELGAPDLIMITQGGISFNEYKVAGPGDTLDRKTFASLAQQFSIDPNTEGVLVRSCMTH